MVGEITDMILIPKTQITEASGQKFKFTLLIMIAILVILILGPFMWSFWKLVFNPTQMPIWMVLVIVVLLLNWKRG